MHPALTRELDLLMGVAFFLVGALLAVLIKAWTVAEDAGPAVFIFGPGASEPERSACEARRRKHEQEHGPELEAGE